MKTSVLKRKRNKKRGRKKSASKSIGQRNLTFVRIIIKRAGLSKCFPARDMEAMVRERKRSRPERCRTEREVLRERLFAESRDPLPHRFGDPLVFLLIYTSVFSLILRFSQFFKTTRLPHAGILRHLVSEAAGRSDLRVQQTERRSLKFFEKAFCVPASPAVA